MKTRHCISGCNRVVPSGLWLCASGKAWRIVIVCVPQTAVGVACWDTTAHRELREMKLNSFGDGYGSIKTGVPLITLGLSSISFSIRCFSANEFKSISRGVILNVI